MDKRSNLYLIPTPLSSDQKTFLLEDQLSKAQSLTRFIVEDPKIARNNLKLIKSKLPLQQLELHILDEHTKDNDIRRLVKMLSDGIDTGFMTDAGAPGVADPGGKLIRLAHMANINIIPLVGPSSILLALMGSGLNGQKFTFNGYLPIEQRRREKSIRDMEKESFKSGTTQIFMEAPYRNKHMWNSLLKVCNPRTELSVAINLSSDKEFIKTASIKDWKNLKWPDIDKVPTMFLISARPLI